jgi:hypothetical protein
VEGPVPISKEAEFEKLLASALEHERQRPSEVADVHESPKPTRVQIFEKDISKEIQHED